MTAHRIQHDVANQFEQVPFTLRQDSFEPALKQMPDAMVTLVERLRVRLIESFHSTREPNLGCLDEQMVVI